MEENKVTIKRIDISELTEAKDSIERIALVLKELYAMKRFNFKCTKNKDGKLHVEITEL